MITEIAQAFQEYIQFVVDAPLTVQITLGLVALSTIASLGKIWSFFKPVRVGVAYPLRGLAWLLNPKPRTKVQKLADATTAPVKENKVPWDITSSKKAFIRTLKAYAGTKAKCALLSDEQIHQLQKVDSEVWKVKSKYDKPLRDFVAERDQRREAEKMFAEKSDSPEKTLYKGTKTGRVYDPFTNSNLY